MKKNNLNNMTNEKLHSDLKRIKTITRTLAITLLILFAIVIYGLIFKDNRPTFLVLFLVVMSFSAILPIQLIKTKNIRNILKLRKSNK